MKKITQDQFSLKSLRNIIFGQCSGDRYIICCLFMYFVYLCILFLVLSFIYFLTYRIKQRTYIEEICILKNHVCFLFMFIYWKMKFYPISLNIKCKFTAFPGFTWLDLSPVMGPCQSGEPCSLREPMTFSLIWHECF